MSRPSASSALRFLTHDVIKKTSLCWALYRMYARPIEIVIRPKISISIFMSATLTYRLKITLGMGRPMSALGQKRTCAVQLRHVRFVPIADIRPSLVKRGSRPNAQRRVAITTRRHLKSVAVGDSDQFPKRNLKASALGDGIAPRGNRRCPEPTGILDIRSLNG